VRVGAGGGIRTHTWPVLSRLPLPIGLHQHEASHELSRPEFLSNVRSGAHPAPHTSDAARESAPRRVWSRTNDSIASSIRQRPALGTLLRGRMWRRRADSNRCIEVLQTSALATWLRRRENEDSGRGVGWSGKRDSNPRPRPWQGRALPLSYSRVTGPATAPYSITRPRAVYLTRRTRGFTPRPRAAPWRRPPAARG
jgi:hypothetical protein